MRFLTYFVSWIPMLVFWLSLSLFNGCAPEPQDHESQIVLDLSSLLRPQRTGGVSASAGEVSRIMASVSGPGIDYPISFEWERQCSGNVATCNFPGTVNFNVPTGNARLIQVLAVTEDSTTQTMSIYFGYQQRDLLAAYEQVNMDLTNLASGATGAEVHGRYMDDDSKGPTGKLEAYYTPPQTGQAVRLYSQEIFDGWFRLFVLDSSVAKFSFKILKTDHTFASLWGGEALNMDSLLDRGSVLRVRFPIYYRLIGSGSGSSFAFFNRETEGNEDMIMGFFGSGRASKTVSYPSSNVSLPYESGTSTGSACNLSNLNSCYFLRGAFSSYTETPNTPGAVALSWNPSDPSQISRVSGGTSESCSSEYENCFSFRPKHLRNGRDAAVGYSAPFKYTVKDDTTGSGNFITTSTSSYGVVLSWALLPGVLSNGAIDGIGIFTKKYDDNMSMHQQVRNISETPFFNCQSLIDSYGFKEYVPSSSTTSYTITSSDISSSDYCKYMVLACPYKNEGTTRRYFSSNVQTDLQSLGNCYSISGGGSSGGMASKLDVQDIDSTATSFTTLARGKCKKLKARLLNSANDEVGATVSYTLGISDGTFKRFGSLSDCLSSVGGGLTSTPSITAGYSSTEFYVRQSAPSAGTFTVAATGGPTLTSYASPITITKLAYENFDVSVIKGMVADGFISNNSYSKSSPAAGDVFLFVTNNSSSSNFSVVTVTLASPFKISYKTFTTASPLTGSDIALSSDNCLNLDENTASAGICSGNSDLEYTTSGSIALKVSAAGTPKATADGY